MSGKPRSLSLEAPERTGTQDPGAHELDLSESDDHFSDAQSSPVPKLRVEKVDDEPSYGEVPGTEAYEKRTEDAAPDEIAVLSTKASSSEPMSPSSPIPKTVVEETEDAPGSTTHHYHENLRQADATPDVVHKPDGTGEANPMAQPREPGQEASGTATKSS
jgi:hypothetical protein